MACAYQVYVCVWESGCRGMLGMLAWLHVWDTSVMKWLNRMTQTQASMCLLLKWDCVTRSFFAASQGYRMERWISLEMSFCTRETTSYLFLCVYICVLVPICPPGQERFGNMTRVYYREAMGAFIVFDVTRPASFEAVTKWKEDLDSKLTLANGKHVATVLLANKCDQGRDVLTNNGIKMEQFCQENGFVGWYETSAKVRKMTHTHTHTSYTASRIVPIAFNRSSEVFAGVSSSSNVFEKQLTPDRLDCVRPSTWFPCGDIQEVKKSFKSAEFSQTLSLLSISIWMKPQSESVLVENFRSAALASGARSSRQDVRECWEMIWILCV